MNKKSIIILIIAIILIAGVGLFVVKNSKGKTESNSNSENVESKIDSNKGNEESAESKSDSNKGDEENMYSKGLHHAEIERKDYGTIKLELDADTAPITVANFAKLVNEGFYDGLTFHRIIDGFMIQGGDPEGNGTGGSSENIKGEFKANGVKNDISHKRGVISMARAQSFNSASSQFFIVHKDSTFLDGQYAGFGNVTEGIETVDKICKDTQVEDSNGTVLKENQPIIEKIVMID